MRKSFLLHTHGDCKSMMKEEEIQIRNLLKFAGVQFRPVFFNLQQTIPRTPEICFTIETRECIKVFVSCICCLLQFRHSLIRIPTFTRSVHLFVLKINILINRHQSMDYLSLYQQLCSGTFLCAAIREDFG